MVKQLDCGRLERCEPCMQLPEQGAKDVCITVGYLADIPGVEALTLAEMTNVARRHMGTVVDDDDYASSEMVSTAVESTQEIINTMRRYE